MARTESSAEPEGSTARLLFALVVGILLIVFVTGLALAPFSSSTTTAGPVLPSATTSPQATATPTPTLSPWPTPSLRPLDAKLSARVLFGQGSVGSDITQSFKRAFRNKGVREPAVQRWAVAKRSKGPVLAYETIGSSGSPDSKLRDFATLVNEAPRGSVDIALMAFNFQDVTAETDVDAVFDSYRATMESLENANPDVTFLYTTVPLTRENSWRSVPASTVMRLEGASQPLWQDNIARERYNTLVRTQYAATDKLFDLAALEARLPDRKVAAKQHEDQWYYVMNPDLSSDGRRLNATGSVKLATELARLIGTVTAKQR